MQYRVLVYQGWEGDEADRAIAEHVVEAASPEEAVDTVSGWPEYAGRGRGYEAEEEEE